MNKTFVIITTIIAIIVVLTSSYMLFTSSFYKQQSLDTRNSEKIFPQVPEGFAVYMNAELGFTVNYPQKWTTSSSNVLPGNNPPTKIIEFSPVIDSDVENYGKPVVRIFTLSMPDDQNLTDFITNRNNAMERSDFIDEMDYTFSDGTIFNKDAVIMELEQKTFGDKFRELTYFVQSNDLIYVIAYVSLASEYESEIDIANEMFSSFRLI